MDGVTMVERADGWAPGLAPEDYGREGFVRVGRDADGEVYVSTWVDGELHREVILGDGRVERFRPDDPDLQWVRTLTHWDTTLHAVAIPSYEPGPPWRPIAPGANAWVAPFGTPAPRYARTNIRWASDGSDTEAVAVSFAEAPPIAEPKTYTCPRCHRTSHNPNDARWRYCGACHRFEDDDA
jgi:hypothetical protein